MAGVDPVASGTAVDVVALAFGLSFGVVIPPDHISLIARVDRVVAIPAEQPVVNMLQTDDRVAPARRSLVHLQAFIRGPARMIRHRHSRPWQRGDGGRFFASGT